MLLFKWAPIFTEQVYYTSFISLIERIVRLVFVMFLSILLNNKIELRELKAKILTDALIWLQKDEY